MKRRKASRAKAGRKPTPKQLAEAVRRFSLDPVGEMVRGAFLRPLARYELEARQRVLRVPRIPELHPRVPTIEGKAKPANPKRARKRRAVGGGRVWRAVQGALRELYPPKGKVPDSVSTKTVRQNVITELGYPVGYNTVRRVLGRGE